jgi:hypothetical protein
MLGQPMAVAIVGVGGDHSGAPDVPSSTAEQAVREEHSSRS